MEVSLYLWWHNNFGCHYAVWLPWVFCLSGEENLQPSVLKIVDWSPWHHPRSSAVTAKMATALGNRSDFCRLGFTVLFPPWKLILSWFFCSRFFAGLVLVIACPDSWLCLLIGWCKYPSPLCMIGFLRFVMFLLLCGTGLGSILVFHVFWDNKQPGLALFFPFVFIYFAGSHGLPLIGYFDVYYSAFAPLTFFYLWFKWLLCCKQFISLPWKLM